MEPGLLQWAEARAATTEQLTRVHPGEYLNRLERLANAGGGVIDADTALSSKSYVAAIHAAGAAIQATRAAAAGQPALAAVRPPGHHATAVQAMGFCLINNVAVAAYEALEALSMSRVLIVDWDVHHGNGTQAIVETDPRIRYVSMHQWPLYPGTGARDETGVGNVFNVPLPGGLPPEQYVTELLGAVERATEAWTPDLILISAGFDAMAGDPLAAFTLRPEHFATWLQAWRRLNAPIALVLEGGYVPQRVASAAVASVEALAHGS